LGNGLWALLKRKEIEVIVSVTVALSIQSGAIFEAMITISETRLNERGGGSQAGARKLAKPSRFATTSL
jgi:hypothetical protein